MVGGSREAVNRCLRKWQKDGLVAGPTAASRSPTLGRWPRRRASEERMARLGVGKGSVRSEPSAAKGFRRGAVHGTRMERVWNAYG